MRLLNFREIMFKILKPNFDLEQERNLELNSVFLCGFLIQTQFLIQVGANC